MGRDGPRPSLNWRAGVTDGREIGDDEGWASSRHFAPHSRKRTEIIKDIKETRHQSEHNEIMATSRTELNISEFGRNSRS